MKICRCCYKTKYPNEFYKKKLGRDGRSSICKDCHNKKQKAYSINYKGNRKVLNKKYIENNPEKYKCRIASRKAVQDGLIFKEPCSGCGSKEKIEMHHKDYSNPLDIIWFCHDCHVREHRKLRMPEVFNG